MSFEIYEQAKKIIPEENLSNIFSTLHIKCSPESDALIEAYPLKHLVSKGYGPDHELWYEIPFGYPSKHW